MDYFDHLLAAELMHDEGFKTRAYRDSKGNWTIGVGHLLGVADSFAGLSWTPEEVVVTFMDNMNSAIYYTTDQIYTLDQLSNNRQRVLVNMMFNLGPHRFAGFKKMIRAINRLDYRTAHREMLDSKWAKYDVPNRANRLANRWLVG